MICPRKGILFDSDSSENALESLMLGEMLSLVGPHAEDLAKIVQAGRLPLTVLMIEKRRRDVAMVCTVTALEVATVH